MFNRKKTASDQTDIINPIDNVKIIEIPDSPGMFIFQYEDSEPKAPVAKGKKFFYDDDMYRITYANRTFDEPHYNSFFITAEKC